MPKTRWKFSFVGRSSSSPPPPPPPPPVSFICPISSSLMFDPVILPTGHTFERSSIEACLELNFVPQSLSSSIDFSPSSSSSSPFFLIPNAALKSAIIDWCDRFGLPHPSPFSKESARDFVLRLMAASTTNSKSMTPSKPQRPAETNNQKQQHSRLSMPSSSVSSCSPSSSSSSSSICSFTSSSSEIVNITPSPIENGHDDDDCKTPKATTTATVTSNGSLEEEIFLKLKSPQISVKDSGLVTLRHSARDNPDLRLSLCTARILAAVVPMIVLYKYPCIQINATASVVNLSIEPSNKVKIVRSGAVPPLVDVLRSSSNHTEEARDNAAGALFSLALEDENKLPIGVLGAIPPLVDLFCQQQYEGCVARVEAGMALYHLSLAPNNHSKIAKMAGAVKALLNVAITTANAEQKCEVTKKLHRAAMMVLGNLARRNEGRVALMDAGAVKAMVEGLAMSKERAAGGEEEVVEEYCLAVMYEMSKGTSSIMRFRALARAAGAERTLFAYKDRQGSGEVGKEMATRILRVIRGDYEERGAAVMLALGDEAEEEGVGSVVSEGLMSFRRKYNNDDSDGSSASNWANF